MAAILRASNPAGTPGLACYSLPRGREERAVVSPNRLLDVGDVCILGGA